MKINYIISEPQFSPVYNGYSNSPYLACFPKTKNEDIHVQQLASTILKSILLCEGCHISLKQFYTNLYMILQKLVFSLASRKSPHI